LVGDTCGWSLLAGSELSLGSLHWIIPALASHGHAVNEGLSVWMTGRPDLVLLTRTERARVNLIERYTKLTSCWLD